MPAELDTLDSASDQQGCADNRAVCASYLSVDTSCLRRNHTRMDGSSGCPTHRPLSIQALASSSHVMVKQVLLNISATAGAVPLTAHWESRHLSAAATSGGQPLLPPHAAHSGSGLLQLPPGGGGVGEGGGCGADLS